MIRVSASTIKSFITCPRQVWYRINAPELAEKTTPQIIGSIVHEAIERFSSDFDSAIEFVAVESSRNGLDSLSEERAVRFVKNFFNIKDELNVDFNKGEFEKQFEVKISNIAFIGRFDFVDLSSKTVIDWKTSIYEPVNLDFDPQFIVYWLAANRLFGRKNDDINVFYVSLSHEKAIKYKPNKQVVDSFLHDVVPSFIRSLKSDLLPPLGIYNYQFPCAHCQFRLHCHKTFIRSDSNELPVKFN
jgi:RecB family exonuclease